MEIRSCRPRLVDLAWGRNLLESVRDQNGRLPDNFVDSAEGADVGLTDVHSDPAARDLLERIDAGVDELLENPGEVKDG